MGKFRIGEKDRALQSFPGSRRSDLWGRRFQHLRLRSRRPGTGEFPGFPGGFLSPRQVLTGLARPKARGSAFWISGRAVAGGDSRNPSSSFRRLCSGSMNDMCLERQFQDLFALVPLSDQQCQARAASHAPIAHVPFDFVVGEMLFPAGAYDVAQTEIPGTLALRRNGCEYPTALVQEIRSERNSSELLFYRQENLYFLAQVLASAE